MGACGAAVAAMLMGYADKDADIFVDLPDGTLTVCYTDDAVFVSGGCEVFFCGIVRLGLV